MQQTENNFWKSLKGMLRMVESWGGVGVDAPFGEGVRLGEVDGVLSDSDG